MNTGDSEDVMNMRFPRLGAFAIAAALQVGLAGLAFGQGGPPPSGAAGQPQGYAGGAPGQMAEPAPSAQESPGTELPVLYVTSVEVMRTSTEPKSTSTNVRTASARSLSNTARRRPASRGSFVRRISPRYCGGSYRRAASEASRTIRTGSI